MLKTNSPQEWVEAAIACGYDPQIVPGIVDRNGVPKKPGQRGLLTNLVDIDLDRAPEAYPKEWGDEICEILVSMGRDLRQAVAS